MKLGNPFKELLHPLPSLAEVPLPVSFPQICEADDRLPWSAGNGPGTVNLPCLNSRELSMAAFPSTPGDNRQC